MDRDDAVTTSEQFEGPTGPAMSEPLVIIGNGMAAAKLCEELVTRTLGRYAIAVVGE